MSARKSATGRQVDPPAASRRGLTLRDLPSLLPRQPPFAAVVAAMQRGHAGAIDGAWGSSAALVVASLVEQHDKPLIVVLPRMHDVDEFADDVFNFLGEVPLIFPAWESWPREATVTDAVWGARLRVLRALSSDTPPRVIVTSGPALMQPVPRPDDIKAATRTLRVGESLDVEELLRWLIERGFERVPAIELPGEVCVHGGIFDVYPSDADDPLRLELFGDELESLRWFDVESQRTIETLSEVCLTVLPTVNLKSEISDLKFQNAKRQKRQGSGVQNSKLAGQRSVESGDADPPI